VPEVEYSTTARLPVETIWEFVHEMDHWATFVAGYQSHEKQNEKDSTWVLKGDVGVLARTVKFAVHIDEWTPPSLVTFSLKGLNEPMEGSGTFVLEAYEDVSAAAAAAPPPRAGWLARLADAIARFLYRLRHGSAERASSADSGPGAGTSRLTFRLRIDPGGPMAPMVNALMKPLMRPAAEDLANQILATLERRHGLA
jgi:carbon monoxide dehydrogenase subunit G